MRERERERERERDRTKARMGLKRDRERVSVVCTRWPYAFDIGSTSLSHWYFFRPTCVALDNLVVNQSVAHFLNIFGNFETVPGQ